MLAYIGLFGSLALLVYLTMRGVNLLISAPLTALIAALTNGLAFFPQTANDNQANFLTSYMDGFTGFITGLALYLASDVAKGLTGQAIVLDGGYTAQ